MIKSVLLILILGITISCGSRKDSIEPQELPQVQGKPMQEPSQIPVGEINIHDLRAEPHAEWFTSGFNSYNADTQTVAVIEENIAPYEIVVFMGTWCHDSRREVPRLFRILEEAGYDLDKLTMYGVDRKKTTPRTLEDSYDFLRVPTIIFFRDGEEVNRIVEYPRETLEKDIAAIVTGEQYSHSYNN